MKMLDFYKIGIKLLNLGLIRSFSIFGRTKILNSSDECIVPLSTPTDRGRYEVSFGEKSSVIFQYPVFKETVMEIQIANNDASGSGEKLRRSLTAKGEMHLIFKSH